MDYYKSDSKEQKRLIELFTALVFIILLILVVLIATRPVIATSTSTISNIIISESFNTVYSDSNYQSKTSSNKYHSEDGCRYDGCYWTESGSYDIDYDHSRKLRYYDRGYVREKESTFTQTFEEYVVYVENEDYVGGYFSVRFYFYDQYGNEKTHLMTKHIGARDEVAFIYRDVDYSSDYYRWDYKVISNSRLPSRN